MGWIVDTSGLSKAVNERLKFPGRTEAEVCNHAAYSVAHKAMMLTPFVAQGKIDTQLGVETRPTLTKAGKISRSKRKKTFTGTAMGTSVEDVTLAKLIILARANLLKKGKQSNFNRITNNRWQIDPALLKGGNAGIEAFISRMIKKRHSSTRFLQAGWLAAKKKLASFVSRKISSPFRSASPGLGDAVPAVEGKWTAQASIENDVGMEGANGESYNKALMLHGQPALQEAINSEEQDLYRYMEEATRKQNEKFNQMAR